MAGSNKKTVCEWSDTMIYDCIHNKMPVQFYNQQMFTWMAVVKVWMLLCQIIMPTSVCNAVICFTCTDIINVLLLMVRYGTTRYKKINEYLTAAATMLTCKIYYINNSITYSELLKHLCSFRLSSYKNDTMNTRYGNDCAEQRAANRLALMNNESMRDRANNLVQRRADRGMRPKHKQCTEWVFREIIAAGDMYSLICFTSNITKVIMLLFYLCIFSVLPWCETTNETWTPDTSNNRHKIADTSPRRNDRALDHYTDISVMPTIATRLVSHIASIPRGCSIAPKDDMKMTDPNNLGYRRQGSKRCIVVMCICHVRTSMFKQCKLCCHTMDVCVCDVECYMTYDNLKLNTDNDEYSNFNEQNGMCKTEQKTES